MSERNADGSWSAWDHARTIDVQIVTVGGDAHGHPMTAEAMLGERPTTSGRGWIGHANLIREPDEQGDALRLTVTAAAENSLISCWIAFRDDKDRAWADGVVKTLQHRE
jgi:hypothetical protein